MKIKDETVLRYMAMTNCPRLDERLRQDTAKGRTDRQVVLDNVLAILAEDSDPTTERGQFLTTARKFIKLQKGKEFVGIQHLLDAVNENRRLGSLKKKLIRSQTYKR